jgi:hypothetical protein
MLAPLVSLPYYLCMTSLLYRELERIRMRNGRGA